MNGRPPIRRNSTRQSVGPRGLWRHLVTNVGDTLNPRRNPVGVEDIDLAQTQGRRGAPTLGWGTIPRWGKAPEAVSFENVQTPRQEKSCTATGERVGSPKTSEPPPRPASVFKCGHARAGAAGRFGDVWDEWKRTWAFSSEPEPIHWFHAIRPCRPTEETRVTTTSPRSGFVQQHRSTRTAAIRFDFGQTGSSDTGFAASAHSGGGR